MILFKKKIIINIVLFLITTVFYAKESEAKTFANDTYGKENIEFTVSFTKEDESDKSYTEYQYVFVKQGEGEYVVLESEKNVKGNHENVWLAPFKTAVREITKQEAKNRILESYPDRPFGTETIKIFQYFRYVTYEEYGIRPIKGGTSYLFIVNDRYFESFAYVTSEYSSRINDTEYKFERFDDIDISNLDIIIEKFNNYRKTQKELVDEERLKELGF